MNANNPETWNAIWSKKRNPVFNLLKRSIYNSIIRSFKPPHNGRLLGAGCGESYLLKELEQSFPVFGIDFSAAACKISKAKGIKTVFGNIHQMPFKKGAFDIIFSQSVIQAETKPIDTIRAMLDIIKPGGKVIFTVPKKYSIFHIANKFEGIIPIWSKIHQRYWNEKEVKDMFGVGLKASVKKIWLRQLLLVAIG